MKILQPGLDCYHGDEHNNIRSLNTNGKDSKRSSAQPCISLIESLQTFPGHESFQLQLNLKNKVFPHYFLRFSLRSSRKHFTTVTSASHLFNFQPSEQTIFLSQSSRFGHATRPQQQAIRSASDQTITPDNKMSLRSGNRTDHAPTPTSDHRQTRPPKSAYENDHHPHIRPADQISPTNRLPSLTAPLQISTGHPTS